MSFLLKPQVGPEHASMLTLVAAMAVASGIQDITGMETKIIGRYAGRAGAAGE